MTKAPGLDARDLARVFPFFMSVDADLRIVALGPSLAKLLPTLAPGESMDQHFMLKRPPGPITYRQLAVSRKDACVLTTLDNRVELKGQITGDPDEGILTFVGTPRIGDADDLARMDLNLSDFAIHDGAIDFLFLMHAQQSSLAEARRVMKQLQEQRTKLRDLNRRVTAQYVATRTLTDATTFEDGLHELLSALGKALGCESATSWEVNGDRIVCHEVWTSEQGWIPRPSFHVSLGTGLVGELWRSGEPLCTTTANGMENGRIFTAERPLTCGVPVIRGGRVVGVLVFAGVDGAYTPDELEQLLSEVSAKLTQFIKQIQGAAEVEAARDAALEAVRVKTEFLANVSHELRTPLNAVIGLSTVLHDLELPELARTVVRDIRSAGDALLGLIDDLIDLSRIESGKLPLEETAFDLPDVLRSSVRQFDLLARSRNLELSVEIDPTLPDTVLGDPLRLRQVITNLVGNAVKFTEVGFVRVRAYSVVQGPGRTHFRIDVIDTGIGIRAEDIERLFQPFTQVDGSTTRKFGGSGLGLAISRRLLSLMGGVLDVASQPGSGSTFRAELELTHAPPDDPKTERKAWRGSVSTQGSQPRGHHERRRILVVEDNPLGQRVAQLMLERLGHVVDVVDNGLDAVTSVEKGGYDLVLMDCHLPGIDGFEATRRIRALGAPASATRIVACTARAMPEDRQRCLEVGMHDVLLKPIAASALKNVLADLPPGPSVAAPRTLTRDPRALDVAVLATLRALGADDQGTVLGRMIHVYLDHAPRQLQALESAVARQQESEIFKLAHALRGMSLNIGALLVARACASIEEKQVEPAVGIEAVRRAFVDAAAALSNITL